jgi:hypothetical protein
MVSASTHVIPPVSAPAPTTARPAATPPASQPAPTAAYTVQISAAAQALQEMTESSTQTTKEANAGDLQAKHLLAREAAKKANG